LGNNNKNNSNNKISSNLKAGEVSKNINGNQLKKENKTNVAKFVNFFKNDEINLLEPIQINKIIPLNVEKIVKNIKISIKKESRLFSIY